MWKEKILHIILKPIYQFYKVDLNSEEISKGLFVQVCLEVDISKQLIMRVKYIRDDSLYECFIGYENITNICYGCGSQSHKFDSHSFKNVAFLVEKLQEPSQVEDSCGLRLKERLSLRMRNGSKSGLSISRFGLNK